MEVNKFTLRLVWGLFFLFVSTSVFAEEIRDYYAEPGLNPFKEEMHDLNESIDPFSGALHHKNVDVMIPGNGGLDIFVNRFYNSVQTNPSLGSRSFTGIGWTMHMGRIVVPTDHFEKICSQQLWSVSTRDNPSIEFPDGGRELLVLKDIDVDETLITKTNWKADCQGVSQGMRVTAPNGTKYYMDVEEYTNDNYSWYVSRIVDLDGNWINIDYGTASGGIKYIDSITASDGRSVSFTYEATDSNAVRLKSITSNGQTVQYDYETVIGLSGGHQYLTQVTRPDHLTWEYTYYPAQGVDQGGSYSMKSVKYPHGGKIEYTYQLVYFEQGSLVATTSIKTKHTSGSGVSPGTWNYAFSPSTGIGVNDKTTVATPDSTIVYEHQGYTTGGTLAWPIGLLWSKAISHSSGKVEEIVNQWAARGLSVENYWHGRDHVDNGTSVPILMWRNHKRDGSGIMTYYSYHDSFGNPRKIEEGCSLVECDARVTNIVYKNDLANWVLGLPETETIDGIGTTTKTYYADGRLKKLDAYGVVTTYEYTTQGDLAKEVNANGIPHSLSNYYRGIARHEIMQVSSSKTITTERTVNPTGTVASVTDGKGITTSFTYDGMNRLDSIDFPVNDDVTIVYGGGVEELTRGNYKQTKSLNGFGAILSMERKDIASGATITSTYQYDALGRKIFQSYPNSSLGITTEYEVLGRPTKITQGNGESRTIEYGSFLDNQADVKVTDEIGNASYSLDLYYGSYEKSLGATNRITDETYTCAKRDALGAVVEIIQGRLDDGMIGNAIFRTYTYDTKRYLKTITNPETGVTTYGRDAIGNMISSQVGDSPTTLYEYDDINRLKFVDYPDDTEDATFVYDDNSNLKQSQKGVFTWDYDFDLNDNLIQEKLAIGGVSPRTFVVGYDYNGLDAVSQITYPNELVVDYLPDAFGRATKAGAFANSVTYHPNGIIDSITYGNGITTTYALNSIQYIENIRAVLSVQGDVVDLQYGYDPIGNVASITDAVDTANNLTLDYDANNRLTSAVGSWGQGTISYSPHGDINTKEIGSNNLAYYYSNRRLAQLNNLSNPAMNNRTQYQYDDYGNLASKSLLIWNNYGIILARDYNYNYDHASNLLSFDDVDTPFIDRSYQYDANNYRVIEEGQNYKRTSMYNKAGVLLYENDEIKCEDTAYIYVGKNMVAKDIKQSTGGSCGTGDTEAPVVTPPADITVEATAVETPVSPGAATAVDNVDGNLTPTPDQTGPFGVGIHTITWSATDSSGNTGTATQTVTVQDTTPPVLTVPADVNVIAAVPATVDIGQATATDIFSVTITNDAPTSYPDGTTVVTWTATDANGNTATGTQNVTVQADDDSDGIPNSADNCTQVSNADQRDTNGDGYGNICDADLNNDGIVNTSDAVGLKAAYGSTGAGLDADLNGDEVVDATDLNIFKSLFGKAPGPSGLAP